MFDHGGLRAGRGVYTERPAFCGPSAQQGRQDSNLQPPVLESEVGASVGDTNAHGCAVPVR